MYCSNGWTLRRREPTYGEIPSKFALAETDAMAQYTCQVDYTFDAMNGYCEANVCPTENILPTVASEVTHDCGGGTTSTSTQAGALGASKFTRTEGRCRAWCIEPRYKGPDKLLECMPSGMYSVYEEVDEVNEETGEYQWMQTSFNTTARYRYF